MWTIEDIEKNIVEKKSIENNFPNYDPQIFADKGYIGLTNNITGAIIMHTKPRGGQLTAEKIAKNETNTHHRDRKSVV